MRTGREELEREIAVVEGEIAVEQGKAAKATEAAHVLAMTKERLVLVLGRLGGEVARVASHAPQRSKTESTKKQAALVDDALSAAIEAALLAAGDAGISGPDVRRAVASLGQDTKTIGNRLQRGRTAGRWERFGPAYGAGAMWRLRKPEGGQPMT